MENTYDFNGPKIDLPNASVVLVLGIISIFGCCCLGIVGIACAIIALILAKSATDLYISDPEKYTENSYKNMNTGKICAWIGLVLSTIHIVRLIWLLATIGFANLTNVSTIFDRFGIPIPH